MATQLALSGDLEKKEKNHYAVGNGLVLEVKDNYPRRAFLYQRGVLIKKVKVDSRRLAPEHFRGVDHVIDLVAISNDPSGELFQDATYAIRDEGSGHQLRIYGRVLLKEGLPVEMPPDTARLFSYEQAG